MWVREAGRAQSVQALKAQIGGDGVKRKMESWKPGPAPPRTPPKDQDQAGEDCRQSLRPHAPPSICPVLLEAGS